MTLLNQFQPGLAGGDSDAYTQNDAILAGQAPTQVNYGTTFDALAQYSLVGRVTITGALVLSNPAAADGSQLPIGVTTHAVFADDADSDIDSNSAVDSNSTAGANDGQRVGFYTDGVFNYDRLVKHGSWTLDALRRALDRTPLGVDEIKTASPTVS